MAIVGFNSWERVNREKLYQLYTVDKKSTREVGRIIEFSQPIVRRLLKHFDIPIRKSTDRPPPIPKGSHLSKEHKERIAKALIGNKNGAYRVNTGKGISKTKPFEVDCSYCGKTIVRKNPHKERNKHYYCCHDHYAKHKSIIGKGENSPKYKRQKTNCEWCGKELIRKACEIKVDPRFFCNLKHAGLWKSANLTGDKVYNFAGGYDRYYGPNWYQQRRLTRERDNHICQKCGKTKEQMGREPDVHHLKAFRTFGLENYLEANKLENLISLCNSCHSIIEGNGNKKELIKKKVIIKL